MRYLLGVFIFIYVFILYDFKQTELIPSEGSVCQKFNVFKHLVKNKHVSHLFENKRYELNNLSKGTQTELLNILDPLHVFYSNNEVNSFLSQTIKEEDHICDGLLLMSHNYLNNVDIGLKIWNEILEEKSSILIKELESFPTDPKINHEEWAKTESEQRLRMYYWLHQYYVSNLSYSETKKDALEVSKRQVFRMITTLIADYKNHFDEFTYKALLQYFDSHSDYFPEKTFSKVTSQMKSSFVGIGVILKEVNQGYKVLELVKGGPAEKQKIVQVNDIIYEASGQSLLGLDIDEIGEYIRGPIESIVQLKVIRGSEKIKISARRGSVRNIRSNVYSSIEKVNKKTYGKIKIDQFYSGVNGMAGVMEDFYVQLERLKEKGIEGLVIDLRGNLGGVLGEVVGIVGLFLKSGPVILEYGTSFDEVKFHSDEDGVSYFDKPVVVLIDESSASASEILSGSMKSLNRAIVVGSSQSFGKGTIQSVGGVENILGENLMAGGMKLTTGYYYLPNGKSVQYEGVKPHIAFRDVKKGTVDSPQLERDYRNSLSQPPSIDVDLNGYKKWMDETDFYNLSLYLKSEYNTREIKKANPKNDFKKAALILNDFVRYRNNSRVAHQQAK